MSKHYLVDENKNLVEGLSKEETYDLLAKAINDKTLPDYDTGTAFITKLKDSVDGTEHKVAFVTQAKYNELSTSGSLLSNCLYYITDDTTEEDLTNVIATAKKEAAEEANSVTAEVRENVGSNTNALKKKLGVETIKSYTFSGTSEILSNVVLDADSLYFAVLTVATSSAGTNAYNLGMMYVPYDSNGASSYASCAMLAISGTNVVNDPIMITYRSANNELSVAVNDSLIHETGATYYLTFIKLNETGVN